MAVDLSKDIVARWDNSEPAHAALLKQAGITALDPSEVQFLPLRDLPAAEPRAAVALTNGLWPGITRPPTVAGRGDETASASVEPWVDSNGYWIGYLRALYPTRPPALGYLPDKLGDRAAPFDSLELALIEAWTAGGNYILALDPRYREALLNKDPKAVAAWEQLGKTARWLRENIALFRQPALPAVTAIVEPGPATAEIANLLYRRHVSPSLATAPAPDPRRLALVAANLRKPDLKLLLSHAESGSSVITAGFPTNLTKPTRTEQDREFFAVGKGQVIAYKKPIADPSEFAFDVIDVITHKRRPVRLWNAPGVIALVSNSPRPTERLLHVINYGAPIDTEIQARVQGEYKKALLLRPDGTPVNLPTAKRGSTTEIFLPELKRLGVVILA